MFTMDVVHPENSSNTCWEGGEIRILSGIHFTSGVFGFDWLGHTGAQPELPALPDPQTSQNNRTTLSDMKKISAVTGGVLVVETRKL